MMTKASTPSGSRCLSGFMVSRPAILAVGSPRRKATQPCASSCTVRAKSRGGSWMASCWMSVLISKFMTASVLRGEVGTALWDKRAGPAGERIRKGRRKARKKRVSLRRAGGCPAGSGCAGRPWPGPGRRPRRPAGPRSGGCASPGTAAPGHSPWLSGPRRRRAA